MKTTTKKLALITMLFLCGFTSLTRAKAITANNIISPDKKITVLLILSPDGKLFYSVNYSGTKVISSSRLGIIRNDGDFSEKLTLLSASNPEPVKDNYFMLHGKRLDCIYNGNRRVFHIRNSAGSKMDVVFQVSNDGVAFRYIFPDKSTDVKKITTELTSFHFDASTLAFLHPCPDSKTGWSQTQPSYEEHYDQGNKVGKPAPFKAGWVFPALFNYNNFWVVITETDLDRNYCASRLSQQSPDGEYSINFPQPTEGINDGAVLPESKLPWQTPWRVIAIGNGLAPIMESTLGTDLSTPAKYSAKDYFTPGKASWSWPILKDNFTTYKVQKNFIDYAADMHWQYCLIDALWDKQIGYDKIKELADYAKTKNVKLLLWYNSAGNWNTTPQTPRNTLLTHELRIKEFQRIKDMGISGIKVDFFGGDGQSMINYYQDILEDAAKFGILVNFHGCTIPRGWERTYPNLVSMEAVEGFEYLTFEQKNMDLEANHCAMLPFTRNIFDPMDFTPMCFSGVPKMQRKTTNSFQLALSVLFLSGIQHYAEIPEGMAKQPAYIKTFLQELPNTWDEVKFIDGYPGKLVVIARRAGKSWYIAGINGENIEKTISIKLPFVTKSQQATLIIDGADNMTFENKRITVDSKDFELKLKGNGGFVIQL